MLFAIDAGHGLYTSGKRCLKSIDPDETREWILNSRIADKVQSLLAAYDCETMRVDDPTGQTDVSLQKRTDSANAAKADFYLSIHANAGINGGSGGGIVVYVWDVDPGEESLAVQKAVYEHTVAETGLKGNRANPLSKANFHVLRESLMPAVLGEFGFMDSTTDTPIILTEDFANKCSKGIVDALVEVYDLKKIQSEPVISGDTVYTEYDGIHDFEVQPKDFSIEYVNAKKTTCGQNFCNAGYFGNYNEGSDSFTLPSGHLVADLKTNDKWVNTYMTERGKIENGKVVFDSAKWQFANSLFGKAVTTLVVQNGEAYIDEVNDLQDCEYAIAGIPVVRNGLKCNSAKATAQGWDKSSLRATKHIFIGLKGDGKIHVLAMETEASNLLQSGEVADKLIPYGFKDVIKLDGGGSFIVRSDAYNDATSEDRRICSIIRFGGCKMGEAEKPEEQPGTEKPEQPVDEAYEQWKSYMNRYRQELQSMGATAAWEDDTIARAVEAGISDGTRPKDFMTRVEGMAMVLAK